MFVFIYSYNVSFVSVTVLDTRKQESLDWTTHSASNKAAVSTFLMQILFCILCTFNCMTSIGTTSFWKILSFTTIVFI